jgi:dolichyl-phosphate-mannose--protein O-mannosyl transferase
MKNSRLSAEWLLIISLALFKLAIHFFTNTNYGLHRDEYLYLALADHLDFGYVSVPPFIALAGRAAVALFGDSVFAVRFFPALIGAASVIIIGLMAKNLGGEKWAIVLACTAFIVSPAFLRSNTLFMPVSFDQFYWLLCAYFMLKLIQTQNPRNGFADFYQEKVGDLKASFSNCTIARSE